MSVETAIDTLGVVLRTTPLRESDLLVVLYTERFGRLSAVARGARRSKIRFAGALSLLVLGKFQLGRRPRGDLWALEGADVVREFTHVSTDVIAVAHASYVAEIVDTLMPLEAPEPLALELIVGLWESLAAHGPSPGALRAIELALLELAGNRPALEQCAVCGETAIDEGAVFDPSRGGALCRRCAASSRGPGIRRLDPATRAYLLAVLEFDSPAAAQALDADPRFTAADRSAGRDALITMIQSLIGKPLRSLEYIAKLGAAGRRAEGNET